MRPALLCLAILTAMWTAVFGMLMVARELLHGGYWVPAAFGTGSATMAATIVLGQLFAQD